MFLFGFFKNDDVQIFMILSNKQCSREYKFRANPTSESREYIKRMKKGRISMY